VAISRPAVAVALALIVSACSSTAAPAPAGTTGTIPAGTSAAPPAAVDPGQVAAATSILMAATFADPASLRALAGIRFSAPGVEAAAALLHGGATGDTLWAATFVYASSATDPAPLRSVATDPAASAAVHAMAAAGLVGNGDVGGFPVLVASLGSADQMPSSDPPETTWEFAADVLERFTHAGIGPSLDATDSERSTAQVAWTDWLAAHTATIRFDSASGLWVIP